MCDNFECRGSNLWLTWADWCQEIACSENQQQEGEQKFTHGLFCLNGFAKQKGYFTP
jgi:hypothetical protein